MGRDFYLEGTLDSARNQYIEFLQLDKNAYGEFNIAFQDWGGGWIEVGNEHAQSAIKIMDQALQYLEKCYQYISDWKNE